MAAKSNSMFRISQLAKDLGIKPKEMQVKLEGLGITAKSSSATLEADEANLLLENMTRSAKIKDIALSYVKNKAKSFTFKCATRDIFDEAIERICAKATDTGDILKACAKHNKQIVTNSYSYTYNKNIYTVTVKFKFK